MKLGLQLVQEVADVSQQVSQFAEQSQGLQILSAESRRYPELQPVA